MAALARANDLDGPRSWFSGRVTSCSANEKELSVRFHQPVKDFSRGSFAASRIKKFCFPVGSYSIGQPVQGWFVPDEGNAVIVEMKDAPDYPD